MLKFPLFLAALAGTLLAACGRSDPALARVGPDAIRSSAFIKEVQGVPFTSQKYLTSAAGRKELLELLVRRKLMLVEAAKAPHRRRPGATPQRTQSASGGGPTGPRQKIF